MTVARHRLHISEISSVGVVEDGDNDLGEPSILLFKAKSTPVVVESNDGDGRGNSVEKARVVREAAGYAKSRRVMASADESIVEMRKMMKTKGTYMSTKPEGRSSAAILAEVESMASNIQKSALGTTKAAAKADVWHNHPDLKTEVRKAQARERDAGKAVAADIDRIVKSYCLSISAEPENMAKTLTQIRNSVMHTAVGLEIKQLRAAAMAGQVGSPTEIAKSAEYGDAWSVLKSWDTQR